MTHPPTRPLEHGVERRVLNRPVAALVCGLTAIGYSSFVFSAWVRSPLPFSRSYASELEAVGQPHRDLFRLCDVLSGAGLVVVAVLVVALVPRRPSGLIGCVLVAVTGVASIMDAANSMSCVPSLDPVCRAQQDTPSGLVQQAFAPHTVSSLVGYLAAGGAMLLVGTAVTQSRPWLARCSIVCAIATGLSGLGDVWLILTDGPVGLTERLRIVVFALWLLVVGVELLRARPVPLAPDPVRAHLTAG
jgi:hypothetical protein